MRRCLMNDGRIATCEQSAADRRLFIFVEPSRVRYDVTQGSLDGRPVRVRMIGRREPESTGRSPPLSLLLLPWWMLVAVVTLIGHIPNSTRFVRLGTRASDPPVGVEQVSLFVAATDEFGHEFLGVSLEIRVFRAVSSDAEQLAVGDPPEDVFRMIGRRVQVSSFVTGSHSLRANGEPVDSVPFLLLLTRQSRHLDSDGQVEEWGSDVVRDRRTTDGPRTRGRARYVIQAGTVAQRTQQ